MKVEIIKPQGYCYGVIRAIEIVKATRQEYPHTNIYILGMIVHNKFIVQALEDLNVKTLDDSKVSRYDLLDLIDEGIVILSAHGSEEKVIKKAQDKGLIVIDAVCHDVTKTQTIIKDYLLNNYEVLYIGKENHPEALAVLSIDEHIHLIRNENDLYQIKDLLKDAPMMITNQTTISIIDAKNIYEKAQTLFTNIIIIPEICNATRIRQEAVLKLNDEMTLVYVVGDPQSNNSNKLAELAGSKQRRVIMIENVADIKLDDLKDVEYVGITSGASTPTYLTNQIITYLKQFNYQDLKTYPKPVVDITKILD
ncbi:MAG: 4-hydroxy-3-methylbut-2-enyl diphosphate reductase [Bacilli bacterium]|jgi:4-hydroxy-3-methylbut-2-enyl diphosphate reductase|nr:4-hydroxy-3-methylbut-2-enyl diphosphate reductase [Bacilli bacterium]